jgi:hypothetical protein
MRTTADLDAFLARTVPTLVHKYMIGGGSVKVCGTISETFGTLARANGFDAYVAGRPGHFVNEVETADGTYEVDLSAIQFECHGEGDVPAALERLTEDPYRAMRVRRLSGVSESARAPMGEESERFYTPVKSFPGWRKQAEAAAAGQYDPLMTWEIRNTKGRPFGHGVPWTLLASVGLAGVATFFAFRSPSGSDTLTAGTSMKTLEDLGASILARTGADPSPPAPPSAPMPPPSPPESDAVQIARMTGRAVWSVAATASFAASFYHGLKRNNSLAWGLGWGVLGSMFPIVTPLYALHQGFAKPHP